MKSAILGMCITEDLESLFFGYLVEEGMQKTITVHNFQ